LNPVVGEADRFIREPQGADHAVQFFRQGSEVGCRFDFLFFRRTIVTGLMKKVTASPRVLFFRLISQLDVSTELRLL
jgi:hypothetical protein